MDEVERRLDVGAEHHVKLDADVEKMMSTLNNGLTSKVTSMALDVGILKDDVAYIKSPAFSQQITDRVTKEMLKYLVAFIIAAAGLGATLAEIADRFGWIG